MNSNLERIQTIIHQQHEQICTQEKLIAKYEALSATDNEIIESQARLIRMLEDDCKQLEEKLKKVVGPRDIYDGLTNENKRDLLMMIDYDELDEYSRLDCGTIETILDLLAIFYPQYEFDVNEIEDIVDRARDLVYEMQYDETIEKDDDGYILWDEYSIGEEINF